MASKSDAARIERLEQAVRVLAVQNATLVGLLAARLTNLELALRVRRTMNQAELVQLLPGSFSKEGFERISTEVRDELLAIFKGEDAVEEADVPARAVAGATG